MKPEKRGRVGESPYVKGGPVPKSDGLPADHKRSSKKRAGATVHIPTYTIDTKLLQDAMARMNAASAAFSAAFSVTFPTPTGTSPRDEQFASLGFAVGLVRGVRSFGVDELGRLTGIHYRQVWVPGENQAQCRTEPELTYSTWERQSRPRPVEDFAKHLPDCVCGFYGYYDGSNDYHSDGRTITGVVEGYGSTVIGTRGFRCEKARIVALHIPDAVKRGGVVVRNYAEVPQFDSFLAMVREFPPVGDEKAPTPDSGPNFWTREV